MKDIKISELSTLVRELRASRKMTRDDFGATYGDSPQNVYNLETGRVNIGLNKLEKLADSLGYEVLISLREKARRHSYKKSMTHQELKYAALKKGIKIYSIRAEATPEGDQVFYRVIGAFVLSNNTVSERFEKCIAASDYEQVLTLLK
jgi:transcriptional regulator with XRE-family HTH domain